MTSTHVLYTGKKHFKKKLMYLYNDQYKSIWCNLSNISCQRPNYSFFQYISFLFCCWRDRIHFTSIYKI
ncbi:hypothetical protein Hanom_Chr12g01126951 [Helianthus anomalus]